MKEKYIEEAANIYNINNWAENYFEITKDGKFAFRVNENKVIAIPEIIKMAQIQSARLPILLRFKHILRSRVKLLHQAFSTNLKSFTNQP